jgi:hypothetical protein
MFWLLKHNQTQRKINKEINKNKKNYFTYFSLITFGLHYIEINGITQNTRVCKKERCCQNKTVTQQG